MGARCIAGLAGLVEFGNIWFETVLSWMVVIQKKRRKFDGFRALLIHRTPTRMVSQLARVRRCSTPPGGGQFRCMRVHAL